MIDVFLHSSLLYAVACLVGSASFFQYSLVLNTEKNVSPTAKLTKIFYQNVSFSTSLNVTICVLYVLLNLKVHLHSHLLVITISLIGVTFPRSMRHHGLKSFSVWVQHPLPQSVFVHPSMANEAPPLS